MKPILNELSSQHAANLNLFATGVLPNTDSVLNRNARNFETYQELLRDDQVASVLQQRRTAITQAEITVEAASDSAADQAAAEDIREQLAAINFDDITGKMHYGVFFGYGVAENMYRRDGRRIILDDIKVRQAWRFKYDKAQKLRLMIPGKPEGVLMPDNKFWTFNSGAIHSDNPYGLGLAHFLYWPVFFKRNGMKAWSIFLDRFAQPTPSAKVPSAWMENDTDPTSLKMINRVRSALQAIQTDSYVILPEGAEIDLIEASRSGTADYESLQDKMDAAISKVILSQTMTTDNGSSRSQAEVHQDVADEVKKADADLLMGSFNQQTVAWLTAWNHPNAQPPKVWRKVEPEEDLKEQAETDKAIADLGLEPTDEYILEKYGPGWRRKATPQPVPMNNGTGPMPADFTEQSRLVKEKIENRADQQDLADAAERLSTEYHELIGDRVDKLLAHLEESDDLETFRERLTEELAYIPTDEKVEKIRNANLFARIKGMFRGERRE